MVLSKDFSSGDPAFQRWQRDVASDQRFKLEDSLNTPRANANQTGHVDPAALIRDNFGSDDFVLAVFRDGQMQRYTSQSLAAVEGRLLPAQQNLIAQQALRRPSHPFDSQAIYHQDTMSGYLQHDIDSGDSARRHSNSTDSSSSRHRSSRRRPTKVESSDDDDSHSGMTRKRQRHYQQRVATVPEDDTPQMVPVLQMRRLEVADEEACLLFFETRFKDLQQSACKLIAKAFVKLIEPRKQTNFPYTHGASKAPPWWPLPSKAGANDGVPHREPDHLLKPARVRLCVHILMLVIDPNARKEGVLAQITVQELEKVTNEAMSGFFNDTKGKGNAHKKPSLKEIFKVAKQQARYKRGELTAEASVMVAHGDASGQVDSDEEEDEGLQYQQEDENDAMLDPTPNSNLTSPQDNLLSPMAMANQNGLQPHLGNGDDLSKSYSFSRDVPMRTSFSHQHHIANPADDQVYAGGSMSIPAQSGYIRDVSTGYSQPPTSLDHSRRSSQYQHGYAGHSQNFINNNWQQNSMVPHNPMPYSNYTTGPSAQNHAAFLPPPTTQHSGVPMLPQPYSNDASMRNYDRLPQHISMSVNSLNHSQTPTHQHYATSFLEDNYGQADTDMRDHHGSHTVA